MGPTSRLPQGYNGSALTAMDIGGRVAPRTAESPGGRVDGTKRQPFGQPDVDKYPTARAPGGRLSNPTARDPGGRVRAVICPETPAPLPISPPLPLPPVGSSCFSPPSRPSLPLSSPPLPPLDLHRFFTVLADRDGPEERTVSSSDPSN